MPADRGTILLGLARQAIAESFGTPAGATPALAWLDEPGATFVTLTQSGTLRGCIGTLIAERPLREDVVNNARAAAFRDPRFPPVTQPELNRITVEVSLLSDLEPVSHHSEAGLLAQLRPGIDGVLLEHGWQRGTFLPQVWNQLPDPQAFLTHLKQKAGLPPDFWTHEIKISRYTVSKWSEGDTARRH